MSVNEIFIENIKRNIFFRAQDIIKNYSTFLWHDYASEQNSSQVIAIDIWGCIVLSPYKDEIINSIFNECEENWEIEFEFRDRDNILNEGYNPKNLYDARTSIDVVLYCRDKVKFIESKFSENYFDICYYSKNYCNGNYEIEEYFKNQKKSGIYKCPFEGKKIRYWDFIPQIYNLPYDSNGNLMPCPFKFQYQIMRNLCLGKAIEKTSNKKISNYLMYINSPKCKMYDRINNQNYGDKLSKYLINKTRLSISHYNGILNNEIGVINKAKNVVQNDSNELKIFDDLEKWINRKIDELPNLQD